MNYQKLKTKYPLTITNYLKWSAEDLEKSNSFNDYLEYFFDASTYIGVAEEYYCDLRIDNAKYIEIIKKEYPELYSEWDEEVRIDLVRSLDNAYKCVEYFLLNGFKY